MGTSNTSQQTLMQFPPVPQLPYAGIRVVEFTHMIMGPSCGMLLADLGAEVIKVEPLKGDNTRRIPGSGAGFFAVFNRNKKSLAVNMDDPRGREVVMKLVVTADIFSENFRDGNMKTLGLDYPTLSTLNKRLIYVSHKGFLPGPYDHRTALDEVVQMMGGLAYMTGPEGQPLRAGASLNDIMGGMFGAIGAMAALRDRERTGRGQEVQSALFENNVFLMAPHMMQFAVTEKPAKPMPSRISAWGIYDVFTVANGEQIFLAVVSNTQWKTFCGAFGLDALQSDDRLATNVGRVEAREWLMPILREHLAGMSAADITGVFEKSGLPYAPITKPQDLFDDPHLKASGGLASINIPADCSGAAQPISTTTPLLPLTLGGHRPGIRLDPPSLGQDTVSLLSELGYTEAQITLLKQDRVVGVG
jgi:crotonobetainyl-CoA:carnitine CoA-transferase CaiB-like acyl-CoA transferase